jgi:hypothetical protein
LDFGLALIPLYAAQQIVGRERRERVSQIASCGGGWFDSRRRVNSTVRRLSPLRNQEGQTVEPSEAEIKNWQRGVLIRKWILGLGLAFVVIGVITLIVLESSKQKPDLGDSGTYRTSPASSTGASSQPTKELRILQEQKTASENLTRRAVELIKANRMSEVRQLYKDRWNELATLRTNVTFDRELTAAEKENIERTLRADQEAITELIAKYDRLYP